MELSQENNTMKRAARFIIVVVGLIGAYMTVAAPLFADGGPIPMCNPWDTKCTKLERPGHLK
jgi:hypothetical protein